MNSTPSHSTVHPEPVAHAQFMAAAAGNDVATLRRYLAQGGDVDLLDAAGNSALVVATRAGAEAFLVELLKAEPKFDSDWEGSAIGIAFATGQVHLAAHIYRAAVARNRPVTIDEVLAAVDRDDAQIVRRYLAQGRPADGQGPEESPLHRACTAGRHALAALLCAAGADPFASKDRPATAGATPFTPRSWPAPLSAAAGRDDGAMVQIMLDAQRSIDATSAGSELASCQPARAKPIQDALLKALIAAARDHRPGLVTQLLAAAGPLPGGVVARLAELALQPSPQDESAAAATLRILLRSTDPTRRTGLRDSDGSTLLHHAAAVDAGWGIDVLVEEGIPVDFAEPLVDDGGTPFLNACKYGSPGSMRRLAALGAALDLRNTKGEDALAVAIRQCDPHDDVLADDGGLLLDNATLKDVVACLLELGCDPDVPDGGGITARMRVGDRPELANLVSLMKAHAARTAMRNTLSAAGSPLARLAR